MPVVSWVTPTAWLKLQAGHFKFHSTAHNKRGPGSRQGPFSVYQESKWLVQDVTGRWIGLLPAMRHEPCLYSSPIAVPMQESIQCRLKGRLLSCHGDRLGRLPGLQIRLAGKMNTTGLRF